VPTIKTPGLKLVVLFWHTGKICRKPYGLLCKFPISLSDLICIAYIT